MLKMQVCVQNLAKYNEGIELYKWVSLPTSEEEIDEALKEIKVYSTENGMSEYFISDYESYIWRLNIDKYKSIYELNDSLNKLKDYDECDIEVIEALIEAFNYSIEEAIDLFNIGDYTYYHADDYMELAEIFVDWGGYGEISEKIRPYINFKAIADDLELNYIQTSHGFILNC